MRVPFSRTLPSLLDEQALLNGDRPAVICRGRSYTYSTLARRANQLAAGLRIRGVRRGDRVAVLMSNQIEWLETCFGASAAGAVVVPISTWSKQAELEFILRDADIRTLFSLPYFGKENFAESLRNIVPEAHDGRRAGEWRSPGLPALRELVWMSADAPPAEGWIRFDALFTGAPTECAPGVGPRALDDALILYTSGSTSTPKAVPLAHFGLIENGFNIGERQSLEAHDRVLASIPLFWAYGSANALPATFTHASTLVLQQRFDAAEALTLIEQNGCTAIYTLPGMTAALVNDPSFSRTRTRSLRTGLTIGSPHDIESAAEILGATNICNIYGSSETYGNCCVTPASWPLARRASCQGPPLPGVSIRLAAPAAGDTVAGESEAGSGLIEVSGYITRGYLGQSVAQNAATFTADGWYRTGDIGRLSADGDIVFVGRNTEMVKRSGINIAPAEVEEILLQHPTVAAAAVVGTPDPDKGEAIFAFVVPAAGMRIAAAELIAHCRARASSYKVPDYIEVTEVLPTTVTGKLLRPSLKQRAKTLHDECARQKQNGT